MMKLTNEARAMLKGRPDLVRRLEALGPYEWTAERLLAADIAEHLQNLQEGEVEEKPTQWEACVAWLRGEPELVRRYLEAKPHERRMLRAAMVERLTNAGALDPERPWQLIPMARLCEEARRRKEYRGGATKKLKA